MKKLKADYKSFSDFLKAYNTSFSIPYYQRKYIWSEKNNEYVLIKFVRDIINQFMEDPDKSYFIGDFAMCRSAVNDIVDGQQRITTLMILLKIISNYTKADMKKVMYNNGNFMLSDSELSFNLRGFLFNEATEKNVNGNIKLAIDLIKKEVDSFAKNVSGNTLEIMKNLGDYILSSVYLSYIEFDNEKEALKYFLNINSLSVPLTEMEIFYAYTSQLIQITRNNEIKIEDLRRNLDRVDEKIKALRDEDFIYIFLKSYFKDDPFITYLSEKKYKTGIGKWLSGYKMDILNGGIEAVNFLDALVHFIYDVEVIADYLLGTKSGCSTYKHIYFNYLYNRYNRYRNFKNILLGLFINRHNYRDNNIYKKGTNDIDPAQLDSYCKAANAAIVTNIFNGSDKDDNLCLLEYTRPKTPASITIKNINYENMFNLNYRTDTQDEKYKISDDHESIQFILSIQEAYLNSIANPESCSINTILYELLDPSGKFTIEHLFTKKDFTDSSRCEEWAKKDIFSESTPAKYDLTRSKFENLSLLDRNTNSSVGAKTISLKLRDYKTACEILATKEPEFLVQSYAEGSTFYSNENIAALKLPSRIIKIDSNSITWEHSMNNRDFIKRISELAIKKIFE